MTAAQTERLLAPTRREAFSARVSLDSLEMDSIVLVCFASVTEEGSVGLWVVWACVCVKAMTLIV